MKKLIWIHAFLLLLVVQAKSNDTDPDEFEIRGVLPWHNFLSGPTAWNQDDYKAYLDWCRELGVNLVVFHNYTGGGERYASYVEPMIRIRYKNVLPRAEFDHSGTSRWGYLPMKVDEFGFGTSELFDLPEGSVYFGSDAALLPNTNKERYDYAQALMKQVLEMAHERDMKMAMGFEYGVAPPEYASIHTGQTYWTGAGSLVYNPFDPDAIGILYATIDDILENYEGLDQIWLWLNEHTMFGVDPELALQNDAMASFFDNNAHYYTAENITKEMKFLGVWAQAYIKRAYQYIQQNSPDTKVVISGWGSRQQLTPLLWGLHQILPNDIIFSVLNPGQGEYSHPEVFRKITKERQVWAIPWLEGDRSLWHLQPRVEKLREQVKSAYEDQLDGVIGIHWRTEEILDNFDALFRYARDPSDTSSTETFYFEQYEKKFGNIAAQRLSPVMAQIDRDEIFRDIPSPLYFAYRPEYGQMNKDQIRKKKELSEEIDRILSRITDERYSSNLRWLQSKLNVAILLDEVGKSMMPAWNIRSETLVDPSSVRDRDDFYFALKELNQAPIQLLFEEYAGQIRSRGELGGLSSLNQRLWGEYQLLEVFLRNKLKQLDK